MNSSVFPDNISITFLHVSSSDLSEMKKEDDTYKNVIEILSGKHFNSFSPPHRRTQNSLIESYIHRRRVKSVTLNASEIFCGVLAPFISKYRGVSEEKDDS